MRRFSDESTWSVSIQSTTRHRPEPFGQLEDLADLRLTHGIAGAAEAPSSSGGVLPLAPGSISNGSFSVAWKRS
jgi:hypothetical protein